jgi:hypothetical protein
MRTIEQNPEHKKQFEDMDRYDFIRAILLPNYFTISKIAREKYPDMPNCKVIMFPYEEFKQRADKESFEDLTDEQWTELNDLSFYLLAYFVWSKHVMGNE